MPARLIAGGAAAALCLAVVMQIADPPRLIVLYNPSASAPVGWYKINANGVIERDVMVAAFAPDDARNLADERGYLPHHVPLIKTVWATGGEKICSENGVVRAPNRPDIYALREDGLGRELPSWSGCITLTMDEVFLVSTDVQTSFDSRYFGPVHLENVLGTVTFIGPKPEQTGVQVMQTGWARVERK